MAEVATVMFGDWEPGVPGLTVPGMERVDNLLPVYGGWRSLRRPDAPTISLSSSDPAGGKVAVNAAYVHPKRRETTETTTWSVDWDSTEFYDPLVVAGTAHHLYGDGADVSRSGGYGQVAGKRPRPWSYTSFGDRIIATNYADAVQGWDVASESGFTDLVTSTDKPRAEHVCVIGNHVLLGQINLYTSMFGGALTGTVAHQTVCWSGTDDSKLFGTESSDPAANTGYHPLVDIPGSITGMVGLPDAALIFKRYGIHLMRLTGGPGLFSFSVLSLGTGTQHSKSIVQLGQDVYFLADDGFRVTRGFGQPELISPPAITRALLDYDFAGDSTLANPNTALSDYRVQGAFLPRLGILMWLFRLHGGNQGNRIVVYNPGTDQWAVIRDDDQDWRALAVPPSTERALQLYAFSWNDVSDETDYGLWSQSTASWNTYEAVLQTKAVALAAQRAGDRVLGVQNADITAIRPIFRHVGEGDGKFLLAVTIKSAKDPRLLVDPREKVIDPAIGHAPDSHGWYRLPGGRMAGEYFQFTTTVPAMDTDALSELIGLQVAYEPGGETR